MSNENGLTDSNVEVEEVEIEVYAKRNEKPPKAKRYKIRVDKDVIQVEKQHITGQEILALVTKTPEQYRLHQKKHGQMLEVKPDQSVDLGEPGVERFTTLKLNVTDGEQVAAAGRRNFRLPEDDEAHLNALAIPWETITEQGVKWLLLHDHPIPPGYNVTKATVAIRIESGYPPSQLDMAYFFPPLTRQGGVTVRSVSGQPIDRNNYQRWSRHYDWDPRTDSLISHHLRIQSWLELELNRR